MASQCPLVWSLYRRFCAHASSCLEQGSVPHSQGIMWRARNRLRWRRSLCFKCAPYWSGFCNTRFLNIHSSRRLNWSSLSSHWVMSLMLSKCSPRLARRTFWPVMLLKTNSRVASGVPSGRARSSHVTLWSLASVVRMTSPCRFPETKTS